MKKIDQLIKAAGENRLLDLVELINDIDVDVNEANDNQLTALMQAATFGNASAIEILLQAGAEIEGPDSKVFSSKQLAELFGHKRVLEVLAQYSGSQRKSDKIKPAPTPEKLTKELFVAIKENDANKLTKMIGLGADVNMVNSDNRSPLMLAVKGKQIDCLKVLIANNAEIDLANKYGYTALMFAAWYGKLEAVKYLAENGANIEFQTNGGATSLMEAATNAQLDVMRYLIDKGAKVDAQDKYGETALMKAVKRGHDINVINYLINHGASISLPNKYGETALQIAKIEGHDEIMEYLKTLGGSIDTEAIVAPRNDTVVNFPEINDSGFAEEVKSESAVNMTAFDNANDVINNTIIEEKDDSAIIEQIFEAIDVNSMGVLKNLINNGANVNCKDNYGWTPLMVAVRQNKVRIVEYLLEAGADVNCVSVSGWTSLRIAASSGFTQLAKILIAAGADIHFKNEKGETALSSAEKNGHVEVINLLAQSA